MNFPARTILGLGLGLLALLLVLGVALHLFARRLERPEHLEGGTPLSSPRAQVEFESGELARALRTRQQERLKHYRDLGDGFVEIPVERAIQHLAEKGAWP